VLERALKERPLAGPMLRDVDGVMALLARHPLFAGIPRADLVALLRRAEIVHLDRNEILHRAGDPSRKATVLLSGAVQIEYPGRGQLRGYAAAMLAAPAFVSEVLDDQAWTGTAVVLLPIVAVGFDREVVANLIAEQPGFALAAYREIAERFRNAIDTWKHQIGPAETVARYLLSMTLLRSRAGIGPESLLEIRQVDLGVATGLRRETINRVLRGWARQGLIEIQTRGLSRIDLEGLKQVLGPERPLLLSAHR